MKLKLLAALFAASAVYASAQISPASANAKAPVTPPIAQKITINPDALKLAALPDLEVSSITLRPIAGVGYAYVCVRNLNPNTATGPFDVDVTMSAAAPSGSPPISWAILVGKIRYPAFSTTTSFVCNDFLLPESKMPNCVKVSAFADSGREVRETNETNNGKQVLSACLGDPPKGPASSPRIIDVPRIPPKLPPITP